MATREMSIWPSMPDASGNVAPTTYDATLGTANDVWKHEVMAFNDTSTDLRAYGTFKVPPDYVGGAAFEVSWVADNNVITGKVRWSVPYRVLDVDGSMDQATAQETPTNATGTTVSGTADGWNKTSIGSPTAGNFVAGRKVEFALERTGSDTTNDTMAARALVDDLVFRWSDA